MVDSNNSIKKKGVDISDEEKIERTLQSDYENLKKLVANQLGCDVNDISQSDYERIQDGFESAAESCIQDEASLAKLDSMGFHELAEQLRELAKMSELFSWAKENL